LRLTHGHQVERPEVDLNVVAHEHVGLAAEQQLHAVDLGPAHLDGHVEAGLFVKPGRLGLVEAAVLGLGEPTRQEHDLVAGDAGVRKRGDREYRCHGSEQRAQEGHADLPGARSGGRVRPPLEHFTCNNLANRGSFPEASNFARGHAFGASLINA
jgi:hypothetical protein